MPQFNAHKIAVIAYESMDPFLLTRWINDGELPHFESLFKQSSIYRLQNIKGFSAAPFWVSAYTGKNPANHGRYNINQLKPGTYDMVRRPDDQLRAQTLWSALDDKGLRCCVIDLHRCPVTPQKQSIIIADWMAHHPTAKLRSYPANIIDDVIQSFGQDPYAQCLSEIFSNYGEGCFKEKLTPVLYEKIMTSLEQRIELRTAMLKQFIQTEAWDLFFCNYPAVHDVGHNLWHLHDVNHDRYDHVLALQCDDPMKRIYKALDQALGNLLLQLPDYEIVIVGGPGLNRVASGNPILDLILLRLDKRFENEKTHFDLTHPRQAESFEKLVESQGGDFDYLKNKHINNADRSFFVIPSNTSGGAIRLNVKGREPNGQIDRQDYQNVCNRLEADLRAIIDVETNQSIVKEIVQVQQIIDGQFIDEMPDLLVRWNTETKMQTIKSDKMGSFSWEPQWIRSGDHHLDGFMFSVNPEKNMKVFRETKPPMFVYDFLYERLG